MRQKVSDKTMARWSRRLDVEIVSMLARGGTNHWHMFVTADHRHGYLHVPDGRVRWVTDDPMHFTSCAERFGKEPE